MNNWIMAGLIGLTCSFSTLALANHHEKTEGMMDDDDMGAMHQTMGMSAEEREAYRMKLNACEKEGHSTQTCEAKLDRSLGKAGSMHQIDEDKAKSMDKGKSIDKGKSMEKAKSMDKANAKGMSAEEREAYMTKLKACEKDGRSAKECQAKLDKQMNKDKMMKKEKDKKDKTY
ncbi:hypothetical protein [Vibrio furnissii]|uniref:hypothetical protein n=1 Tax=Vibrio furnissii TaxID=29494 RepID=UPI001EEBD1AE|nr:hypothetical protein [Vibrio furnissii]